MNNTESILWGKLAYVYTSLIELLPNIVAGTVAFAVFIGGPGRAGGDARLPRPP